MADLIESVAVVTVRSPLPMTIRFGQWVMTHREFALCRIRTEAGLEGFGFVYTRDGPIAALVRRNIAPLLIGQPYDDPAALHWQAAWSNNAILANGIGLRALGLVDLATWDLAARAHSQSISAYLGGERRPMPVTAIIGYPPSLTPEQVAAQVETYLEAGWRRFKQPIAGTLDETRARLRAARSAMGPDCWLGMDCNWVFKQAQDAIDFAESISDVNLGWMEDVVPPGNARMVAEIRKSGAVPVAMGDEQGGTYHPESLLAHDAVDVERIDVTTYGGITRLRDTIEQIEGRASPSPRTCSRTSTRRCSAPSGTTTSRSSGAFPAAASTSSPTRSHSPSCATGAWIRCPRRPASARSTTPPGSHSSPSRTTTACSPSS